MLKDGDKKRILIIEDDRHIADGLQLNFTLNHYEAIVAENGVSGLDYYKSWRPDLIVLDIMLPVIDGFSVLQHIRLEDDHIPILILSARNAAEDKIKGLTQGVDDYMAKPFDIDELLLRVKRLLKRASFNRDRDAPAASSSSSLPEVYHFGGNRIDFKTATADGKTGRVHLTEQEVKLLKLFIKNKGKPLSRKILLQVGWGYSHHIRSRTIDNFIVRFRKYFETNPKKPKYFKSLRSVGYLFDDSFS